MLFFIAKKSRSHEVAGRERKSFGVLFLYLILISNEVILLTVESSKIILNRGVMVSNFE